MKRFIAFIIAFFMIMALPLSISADLPENDALYSYDVKSLYITTNRGDAALYDWGDFNFGSLYRLAFEPQVIMPYEISIRYQFTLEFNFPSNTDLYICTRILDGDLSLLPSSIINSDTQESFPIPSIVINTFPAITPYMHVPYRYNVSEGYISEQNSWELNLNSDIPFYCISGIPSGRYLFTFDTLAPFDSSLGKFNLPLGFFADNRTTGLNAPDLTGDPVLDYEAGYISFQDASQQIRDEMNQVLNDQERTDFEKQFAVGIADTKLNQLQDISNEKFSSTVDNFESQSESIVQDYYSDPSTDILPVINDLNKVYTDTLTQATSPEQGMLINAQYSVKLAQLQAGYQVAYKEELEGVLSDEDMQHKQDSYDQTDSALAAEDEALDIFRESDYQSQLVFDNWLNQFSQYGDITVYRSIFEFFFEDPSTVKIQPFLTIPFSLVLVGVLLATTTVVFRRRS